MSISLEGLLLGIREESVLLQLVMFILRMWRVVGCWSVFKVRYDYPRL